MAEQLRAEIKQPKPFRSLEAEVFLNVLRTATALLGEFSDLLRPYGLSQPQYNVLRILRGAGDVPLPCGEIGERMVGRDPDITRLLDRMEKNGLVRRERGQADRRVIVATLTTEGRRVVDELDEPVGAMHTRQLAHLTQEELRELSSLLERAREHLGTGRG